MYTLINSLYKKCAKYSKICVSQNNLQKNGILLFFYVFLKISSLQELMLHLKPRENEDVIRYLFI